MGIQWRIRYRLSCELPYLISKAIILLFLLEFILWKRQKGVKMCLVCLRKMNSTIVCSQTINKKIADGNFTDYSFLSWIKQLFKRRYRIRHWIPMFIGTPCIYRIARRQRLMYKYVHSLILIVATTLLIFTFQFEHLRPIPYSITTPPPPPTYPFPYHPHPLTSVLNFKILAINK